MNYEEIQSAIGKINSTIRDLGNQVESGNRDKVGLRFNGKMKDPTGSDNWRVGLVTFDAMHGYYGNSGCSDDMSEHLVKYIVAALNELKPGIVKAAINIAERERAELANRAKEEAEKILELAKRVEAIGDNGKQRE